MHFDYDEQWVFDRFFCAAIYNDESPNVKAPLCKFGLDDGWTEWLGGDCPIPPITLVEYKTKIMPTKVLKAHALSLRWRHIGSGDDIFSYRIIKEAAKVSTPGLPDENDWIPWSEGGCHLANGIKFQAKFSNGLISDWVDNVPGWRVSDSGSCSEIVAYRLFDQPKPKQEQPTPTPDPHAALKAQYALDDAALNGKGWRVWQFFDDGTFNNFRNLTNSPSWLFENEYRRHPNADAMIEYIQGGERPEEWEWTWGFQNYWYPCNHMRYSLEWEKPTVAIRRRRETIVVNDIEINAHYWKEPEKETRFYVPALDGAVGLRWHSSEFNSKRLEYGICFKTKEDADVFWDIVTAPGRDYVFNAGLRASKTPTNS
jgi:hypothetical protein